MQLQNAYATVSDPEKRRAYNVRWAGIKEKLRAQRESDRHQAEAAETEKKRTAAASAAKQKEDDARQEHLRLLRVSKLRYDNDIFETRRIVRRLAAELKRLQDQDDEDSRKDRERNGWWAYLASPIYGKVSETDEEKQARETERLHRLASRSIKENELREKEAKLQRQQDALQNVNNKIAAEKKKEEDEALAQTRAKQARMEQEAKDRAQQGMFEFLANMRKQQEERAAAAAAAAAREAQAARAQEAQKAREAQRAREVREAREAQRAREVREAREEERAREVREAREAERAREVREAQWARQVRQASEAQERARTAESWMEAQEQIQAMRAAEEAARKASVSARSGCRHGKFWPKLEGRQICDSCHIVQKRFAYQCPGCRMVACANCRQALRGTPRKSSSSGQRFADFSSCDYGDYD
jgi:hypothetical protein